MNIRMTVYILGLVLFSEGGFLLIPAATAAVYRERTGFLFVIMAAACMLLGALLSRFKPKVRSLNARDGFLIVALSWIVLSVVGALPFYISGSIPSFVNALFESVSGFTTTGASILHALDPLPRCMIMWRSFMHWIGGMGVLVFLMAFLPIAGGKNMYLMQAESPGPSVSKLVPRIRDTAMWLYGIYFGMTLLELVLLLFAGVPLFDAINLSVATAGTGGFGVRDAGMGIYSDAAVNIITVAMILFGVNFTSYFLLIRRRFRECLLQEVRVYIIIVTAAIALIVINNHHMFPSVGKAIQHTAFTVGSLISSTGFSTADFDRWPALSRTVLVMCMFVGACAGSTGGGIKVSRFILLCKNMSNELRFMIHPKQVKKVHMDGEVVEPGVLRNVNAYMTSYILLYAASLLILSLDDLDLTTNFTAVVATLNNIGPGLNQVGPTQNFDVYSNLSKSVLIFDMLAGRLELFPILLLLAPSTWKK